MQANDVWIDGRHQSAKVRSPWLVLLFTLLTFGIYGWFWWYFVNRELRDLGLARGTEALGKSPGLSVLAYTLGGIVYIPLIWTVITTNHRVREAQRLTVGLTHRRWIASVLWIFTLTLGGMVYLQYQLNRVWRAPGMLPQEAGDWAVGDSERVEKLDDLQRAGALTEAEYSVERARLRI